MKNPPMRMLILLAVFWGAGSLLLAAESPSTPKPADAAKEKEPVKEEKKEDDGKRKASIAEQAEAALKAAAEADAGSAKEPAKSDGEVAKDDTQAPPSGGTGKAPSPQRFVPTEQVRADFDVSFPIDI
jgi:hypothetical protein